MLLLLPINVHAIPEARVFCAQYLRDVVPYVRGHGIDIVR
jgi:hypothetical protein